MGVRFDIAAGKTDFGGNPSEYSNTVWVDYNKEIEYIYDWSTDACISFSISYSLGNGQLPPNANFVGTILLGAQPVHEYFFPISADGVSLEIEIGLMAGSCLPYNVEYYNTSNNSTAPTLALTEALWNVVPSVPPFAFRLPASCSSNNLVSHANFLENPKVQAVRDSLRLRALINNE